MTNLFDVLPTKRLPLTGPDLEGVREDTSKEASSQRVASRYLTARWGKGENGFVS